MHHENIAPTYRSFMQIIIYCKIALFRDIKNCCASISRN